MEQWLRFWNEEEAAHYYYCPQSGATEWLLPAGAAWTDGEDDAAAANTIGMSRTQTAAVTGPTPTQVEVPAAAGTTPAPRAAESSRSASGVVAAVSSAEATRTLRRQAQPPAWAAVEQDERISEEVSSGAHGSNDWLPPGCPRCRAAASCVEQHLTVCPSARACVFAAQRADSLRLDASRARELFDFSAHVWFIP